MHRITDTKIKYQMFEVLFESEYLKKCKDRYKMTRVFLTKYHCSRFQYELIDLTYIH